jgi:hypothetical protein
MATFKKSKKTKAKGVGLIKTAKIKRSGINRKYTHFAVLKKNNKIVNGWEYKGYDPEELKSDKNHYFNYDLRDMEVNHKDVSILKKATLIKRGIDPFDNKNWNNVGVGSTKTAKTAKVTSKNKYPQTFKCVIDGKNHSAKISRDLRDKHQPYKVENTQNWTNWLNIKRFAKETEATKYFKTVVAKFKKASTKTKAKGVGAVGKAKKGVKLPYSNFILLGSGHDVNGNKIVKLQVEGNSRGFSIQTNGNLPKTHSILHGLKSAKDMQTLSMAALDNISKEVCDYIEKHGSANQKKGLGSTKTEKKTLSGSKYHRVSKSVGGVMNSRKQMQLVQLGSMKPAQRFMFPKGKATYTFKGFTKANAAKYESERGGTYVSQNLKINVALI